MNELERTLWHLIPSRPLFRCLAILAAIGTLAVASACSSSPAPSPTAAERSKAAATALPAAPTAAPATSKDTQAKDSKPIIIRLSVDNPDGLPRSDMEKRFADLVKQKTNGKAEVQIFWSGSLGGVQTAAIQVVQNKGAEAAIVSSSNFAAMQPSWMLLDLPFLTKGRAGYYKLLDSPVFDRLRQQTEKEANLSYLFTVYDGYRSLLTSKKQVKSPADLKGLKLRTTNSPIEVAYVKAFGASPSPIDWGETYLALKQGLVDGYFIGYTTVINFKQEDASKYACDLNVVPINVPAFINTDFLNALPGDIKKAVLEAGREADLANRKQDEKDLETAQQKLVDTQGLVVYKPSESEMETWRKLALPVYDEFKTKLPEGLIQQAMDAQN